MLRRSSAMQIRRFLQIRRLLDFTIIALAARWVDRSRRTKFSFLRRIRRIRVTGSDLRNFSNAVPPDLTDDRTPQGIANTVNTDFNSGCGTTGNSACLQPNQIDPVALALLQGETPQGNYLIPSAQTTDPNGASFGAQCHGPGPPATIHCGSSEWKH